MPGHGMSVPEMLNMVIACVVAKHDTLCGVVGWRAECVIYHVWAYMATCGVGLRAVNLVFTGPLPL